MTSWMFLHHWHQTPHDLGADWDDVDPVWQLAMISIEAGVADGRK